MRCEGPVADGAELDTSREGSHEFTVVAEDAAGNRSERTHRWSVACGEDGLEWGGGTLAGLASAFVHERVEPLLAPVSPAAAAAAHAASCDVLVEVEDGLERRLPSP